jgi:hypothetical protein
MQFLYPPLNVISRLLLSKSASPKVIIISGLHCTWFPSVSLPLEPTYLTAVLFRQFRTVAALHCSLNLKVAFRGRLGSFQCTCAEGVGGVDSPIFLPAAALVPFLLHRTYFSATCPSPGRVTVPPAIDLSRSHIAAIVEGKQEDFSFAGNIRKLRYTKCFSQCSVGWQFSLSNANSRLYIASTLGHILSQLYSLYSLISIFF